MKESNIMRSIMLVLSRKGKIILFRNNVGTGWQGESGPVKSDHVTIKNPRPIHAGLCKGSSDLIGWTKVEITSEMVGKQLAVFTAIEVKSPRKTGTPEQLNFINNLNAAGGIAGVATNETEADELVSGIISKFNTK